MIDKGLNIHFLDYFKLKRKLRSLVHNKEHQGKGMGPFLPRLLIETGLSIKGCSNIYNKLMIHNGNILKGVKEKWEIILNEEINYKIIETAFKEIPNLKENAYQKYLQFKLLHTRTATNDILNKMEIIELNKCLLCETVKDDIKHAFLECSKVEKLWQDIEKWIKDRTQTTVKLSFIDQIFGRQNAEELIDKIILSAKVTIFNNRKNGKKHHIEDVKRLLFRQLKVEEYHASLHHKEIQFTEVWGPIYDELYNKYT